MSDENRFVLTFLVFSPFPLIADLYRAHGQYYCDDKEQQSADNSRRNRLVFNSGRHGEFYFFAIFKTF